MDALSRRSGWTWTVLIVGSIAIGCATANSNEQEKSITCYQCNSEYDPRCGDPFDPYTLGTVNCSMKKPLEHMPDYKPVLCRKTMQKVQGKIRVIRGCGYLRNERDDGECMKRSGTHDVQLRYCSCSKNLCNSAEHTTISSNMVAAFVTLALTLLLRQP
ncbi:UPAR/Ly6 domain-containing protein crok-like [Atheta coriaria]|uniref:UPAR/Ly6 domain-containing protein crok-like n=1 Tax=Dalotia coriaria TaxID=877792 RepID=UPI0031F46265